MSKRVLLVIIAVALLSIAGGVTYMTKQQAEIKKAQQEFQEQHKREVEADYMRLSPAARKAIEEQRRKQKNSGN